MNKTETANQLRLAAGILETGHPWERYSNGARNWIKSELPVAMAVSHGDQIRPILATPPDNRPLHNPDSLAAEQVGLGYRLPLVGEPAHTDTEAFRVYKSDTWERIPSSFVGARIGVDHGQGVSLRLPLSVPWPEPKLSPLPEPATRTVELGPEDVPPGSVFRGPADRGGEWAFVLSINKLGMMFPDSMFISFQHIKTEDWQINRSIPLTGRWNPDAWEPCHKTISPR